MELMWNFPQRPIDLYPFGPGLGVSFYGNLIEQEIFLGSIMIRPIVIVKVLVVTLFWGLPIWGNDIRLAKPEKQTPMPGNFYITNTLLGLGWHPTLTPQQWLILDGRAITNSGFELPVSGAVTAYSASVFIDHMIEPGHIKVNEQVLGVKRGIQMYEVAVADEVIRTFQDRLSTAFNGKPVSALRSIAEGHISAERIIPTMEGLQSLRDALQQNEALGLDADVDVETLGAYFSRTPNNPEGMEVELKHPDGPMAGLTTSILNWPVVKLKTHH